jgi:hypothetical protein
MANDDTTRLRQELQLCESRVRLALLATEALQRAVLSSNLSVEQLAVVYSHIQSIMLILRGEVLS